MTHLAKASKILTHWISSSSGLDVLKITQVFCNKFKEYGRKQITKVMFLLAHGNHSWKAMCIPWDFSLHLSLCRAGFSGVEASVWEEERVERKGIPWQAPGKQSRPHKPEQSSARALGGQSQCLGSLWILGESGNIWGDISTGVWHGTFFYSTGMNKAKILGMNKAKIHPAQKTPMRFLMSNVDDWLKHLWTGNLLSVCFQTDTCKLQKKGQVSLFK